MSACSVCEGAFFGLVCEQCTAKGLRPPTPQALTYQAFIIVVKRRDGGDPDLVKAFPMDPSPVGRMLEGVPVSMGAFWATREEADLAHQLFVPAADRPHYEVREITVSYVPRIPTQLPLGL